MLDDHLLTRLRKLEADDPDNQLGPFVVAMALAFAVFVFSMIVLGLSYLH